MSIKIASRVWEHSPQSGAPLLILLALADFSNDEGVCWPLLSTLAKKSRLGDRATQKWLSHLQAGGDIYRSQARGRGSSSKFLLIGYIQPRDAHDLLINDFELNEAQTRAILKRVHDHSPFQMGARSCRKDARSDKWVHARAERVHVRSQRVHARAPRTVNRTINRTVNKNHQQPQHGAADDASSISNEKIFFYLQEMQIDAEGIRKLMDLPHLTETFAHEWYKYAQENKQRFAGNPKKVLGGGFYFTRMRDGRVPPNWLSVASNQWQREQAAKQARTL